MSLSVLDKVKKRKNAILRPVLLKNHKTLITLNEDKSDTPTAALKLSQTKDFGLHTGLNVSSLLILQKKFNFSTNSSKKKWPVVKSGMIGLFHNMVQNDKKWGIFWCAMWLENVSNSPSNAILVQKCHYQY